MSRKIDSVIDSTRTISSDDVERAIFNLDGAICWVFIYSNFFANRITLSSKQRLASARVIPVVSTSFSIPAPADRSLLRGSQHNERHSRDDPATMCGPDGDLAFLKTQDILL